MADQSVIHEPRPDEMPDIYASVLKGDCLEPMFEDGACLVFDKNREPDNGDFVGIWLHPDAVAAGESTRRIKRLVTGPPPGMSFPVSFAPDSELQPIIILEQLNPRGRFAVPGSQILAMHKVIGEAVQDGGGQARMTRLWVAGQMMRCFDEN
jgi:hypothetical protein